MIAWEQFQGKLEAGDFLALFVTTAQGRQNKGDGHALCFSKSGQQGTIDLLVEPWYGKECTRAQRVDMPGLGFEDERGGKELKFQSAVLLITVVDQAQLSDHRYRVLEVSQVELGDQRGLNADGFYRLRLDHFCGGLRILGQLATWLLNNLITHFDLLVQT